MYCMSQKHRTFSVALIKSEFLVQIIVSILFAGSYTGLSKKMDGIWNRYNLKSTGRI